MLNIRFCFVSKARDPGFCKLNTSFLNETEYINQIRTVIENTHNEYLHDNTVNNALLWEMIKIREHSIKYATAKKAKTFRREEELEKEINTLQNFNGLNASKTAEAFNTLDTKKRELEETIEHRTKGSI